MSSKLQIRVGTKWYRVEVEDITSYPVKVWVEGEVYEVSLTDGVVAPEQVPDPQPEIYPINGDDIVSIKETESGDHKFFNSPMPGSIVSISVKVGDLIEMGDPVCILEAMKMQQTIIADMSGEVMSVLVDSGDQISQGDPICTFL